MIWCDGSNAFFLDWGKRRISGWNSSVMIGTIIYCKMQSGKTAMFEVINIRRPDRPRDQYFADVRDLDYK